MPPSPSSSGAQLKAQPQSQSPSPAKASKSKDPRDDGEEAGNDGNDGNDNDEREQAEDAAQDDEAGEEEDDDGEDDEESSSPDAGASSSTSNPLDQKAKEREARFRALRARAKTAATSNLKEVYAERRRQSTDPRTLTRLQRLRSEAEYKLAKSTVVESGGDFERKRAWDWTAEESTQWDRKLAKKNRHREDVAFQDYTQAARKQYKKQLRDMGDPDLVSYNKEKSKLIRDGQVYEVEGEDGEVQLVAVDRDGEFYADKDSLGFVDNKPRKEKVDRLVGELKKEEEKRSKRGRGKEGEEDVTYINDKNKQFNMKLARYYNKYTGEIRDSFERGTMI